LFCLLVSLGTSNLSRRAMLPFISTVCVEKDQDKISKYKQSNLCV
jgi:hypothetical protein